jgi:hypothetical protein
VTFKTEILRVSDLLVQVTEDFSVPEMLGKPSVEAVDEDSVVAAVLAVFEVGAVAVSVLAAGAAVSVVVVSAVVSTFFVVAQAAKTNTSKDPKTNFIKNLSCLFCLKTIFY